MTEEKQMTTAEMIVEMLEEAGVEYIFGVPGGAIEDLNTALYKRDKIKPIVTKHEEGAAFMADAYARVSGKIGVCCATAGPGASNLITGIASALGDSIPILALTGQVATTVFGKGAIQELGSEGLNITNIFRNFTKYSGILNSEHRATYVVQKALRLARSRTGRTGPVHLSLPANIMKLPAPPRDQFTIHKSEARLFSREGLDQAAKALLEANKPVIIAGWGVVLSRAAKELENLAKLLNIPVATSPKGKGVFPETDPVSLGVLGFAGNPAAKEYIFEQGVDVMLAVGTSFNEMMTSGWPDKLKPKGSLIQIDVDPEEIGKNYHANIEMVGDARAGLEELYHAVERQIKARKEQILNETSLPVAKREELAERVFEGRVGKETNEKLKAEIASLQEKHKLKPLAHGKNKDGLYHPRQLMEDLQTSCPDDTIFFADMGTTMAWSIRYMVMSRPYSFYLSLGFSSMGFAVAAPVGAWLAFPDRPIVAMVGDGSFQMNGFEVATAVNYKIPVIWVILNNAMLGMVHHGRKLFATPIPEGIRSDFQRVDFAKIAEGLGARGVRVNGEKAITKSLMDDLFQKGQEDGLPTVLDVWVDHEEVPPIHARIQTVEKHF